jgi:uncharacterized protein (DUF58 family)
VKEKIKQRLNAFYQGWLNKRLPASRSIQLTQKRIFIIPNKIGLLYLVFIGLVFVTGVNFQNNLVFSLSVLLVSIFITAIVSTYQNLSGLVITAGHSNSVFVGKNTELHLTVEHSARKEKQGLWVGFDRKNAKAASLDNGVGRLVVNYKPKERGYFMVPRITLFSRFPLGILTCWTWLRLKFEGVAYPSPVYVPYQYIGQSEEGSEDADNVVTSGIDDFHGFKNYQAGDSLKHVAWRQFAKNGILLTKEFEQAQAQGHWLEWEAIPGLGMEARLQILCGWVMRSYEEDREFGLTLPTQKIPLGRGDIHRDTCLKVLALYGLESASQQGAQDEG